MDNQIKQEELETLFHTFCNGLRQELQYRYNLNSTENDDFSLLDDREINVAASLACQLRAADFFTRLEAYFPRSTSRRPDFGIWLPTSKKQIFFEFKQVAWGRKESQYRFSYAREDIRKLYEDSNSERRLDGLIVLGFGNPDEKPQDKLLNDFHRLSHHIINTYPYKNIGGLQKTDITGLDKDTSYAVIGMWFRNSAIREEAR